MTISKKALSLLVVFGIIIAGGLGWFVYSDYTTRLVAAHESEKEEIARIIGEYADSYAIAEEFTHSDTARHRTVFSQFFSDVQSADIFRVKVWNREYTVIWSDLTELIGQQFPDNHDLDEVLATGEPLLEVGQEKIEHETERQVVRLLEVYVPVKNSGGEVVGIFEVYKVATTIDPGVSTALWMNITYAVIGFVIAMAIMFFLVRRI